MAISGGLRPGGWFIIFFHWERGEDLKIYVKIVNADNADVMNSTDLAGANEFYRACSLVSVKAQRDDVLTGHDFTLGSNNPQRDALSAVEHSESLRYMYSFHANSAVNSCEKIWLRDGMSAPRSSAINTGRSPTKRNVNFIEDSDSLSLSTSIEWSVMIMS